MGGWHLLDLVTLSSVGQAGFQHGWVEWTRRVSDVRQTGRSLCHQDSIYFWVPYFGMNLHFYQGRGGGGLGRGDNLGQSTLQQLRPLRRQPKIKNARRVVAGRQHFCTCIRGVAGAGFWCWPVVT